MYKKVLKFVGIVFVVDLVMDFIDCHLDNLRPVTTNIYFNDMGLDFDSVHISVNPEIGTHVTALRSNGEVEEIEEGEPLVWSTDMREWSQVEEV